MVKNKSLFIALICGIITLCICVSTAFAEETTKYWEPIPYSQGALGCVNGEPGDGIYLKGNTDDTLTISYEGDGTLTGWEFPTLQENKDYEVISRQNNSITLKMLNGDYGLPYINALVHFDEVTSEAKTPSDEAQTDQTTLQEQTTNKNPIQKTADENKLTADKSEIKTDFAKQESVNAKNIIYVCTAAVLCVIAVILIRHKKAH